MRKFGDWIAGFGLAVRLYFMMLVSTVGSAFVGAVFGAGAAADTSRGAVIGVSVVAILLVLGIIAKVVMSTGVSDDEIMLRRMAVEFARHRRSFARAAPKSVEVEDAQKATRLYRRRVREELLEAREALKAANRRVSALERHLADIRSFERDLEEY